MTKGTADDDPRRVRLNRARDQAADDLYSTNTHRSPASLAPSGAAVGKKFADGQTERGVLNLGDSDVDVGVLRKQFQDWPMGGLKEVLVVDRAGNVVHFYP
ncbi:hypothetical protein ABT075_44480 [Streptomyces sp. NPDC002677]|uniref:hypothetical protein n=1 Tax=Streptomyces sp. NPDC002677 TaxID=3154774 RepID=UPI003329EDBD